MILEISEVTKHFGTSDAPVEVLKGVNLNVKEGETVAILGRSGSGKSTLLSLIAGLDKPSQGQIKIEGKNLAEMNEETLSAFRAAKLGIVFQQFYLLKHLTALENVALPLELAGQVGTEEKSLDALTKVGLRDRLHHYPYKLSGGEQQRVAIARAMVSRPSLLLADEPSGFLDHETGEKVMDLLFELVETQKMTLVLVTHSEELARKCHRIARLKEGRFQ